MPERQARIFGRQGLIASEEAGSRAGRQHAQMTPRADAARTRARPPPGGRHRQPSIESLLVHGQDPLARAYHAQIRAFHAFPPPSPAVLGFRRIAPFQSHLLAVSLILRGQ